MTTTTLTLTSFLLARIAEDEAATVCRHGVGCRNQDIGHRLGLADCNELVIGPRRWLAECGAKRELVEAYQARDDDVDLMLGPDVLRQREWSGLRMAARIIAAVYSDHPDYREEWRP